MKKLFCLSIVLIVIVTTIVLAVACGKKKHEEEIIPTEVIEMETIVPFVNVIVVNEEDYSVIFTNYDYDDYGNFYIEVTCDNRLSDKVLVFSIDRVSVNDCMIDPWWAVEVKPNCISNSIITFYNTDLKYNKIEQVQNINFDVSVYNSDDLLEDSLYESNFNLNIE